MIPKTWGSSNCAASSMMTVENVLRSKISLLVCKEETVDTHTLLL